MRRVDSLLVLILSIMFPFIRQLNPLNLPGPELAFPPRIPHLGPSSNSLPPADTASYTGVEVWTD